MSCGGCKKHVEEALSKIEGVEAAIVNLEGSNVVVSMTKHISFDLLENALSGSQYKIHHSKPNERTKDNPPKKVVPGSKYYCPMRCEGDKEYDEPGDCPVCGMDLVSTSPVEDEAVSHYRKLSKKFIIASLFTIPVFIIAMSEMVDNNPLYELFSKKQWNWIQMGLSIPVIYSTWMFFQRGYSSIVRRSPNMFTLISLGAGAAIIFSVFGLLAPGVFPDQFKSESGTVDVYFEAATVILTLVLLGQLLEAKAHSRTNSAIKELLELAPTIAYKVIDGKEEEVSIELIQVGDMLRVKPGDKIPVDGVLIEGTAIIDESMITGEPIPVDKHIEDALSSGTINGTTSFLMRAEKIGSETLLSQIIHMVDSASKSRAPIQNFADKISSYFVPTVVVVSIITFIIWAIIGPEPRLVYAFVNAVAVLIISCPCALGLATPMSVMVGVGKAAQTGVLIKNAESLELMSKVDVFVVDKTGTITEGKPSVEDVLSKIDRSVLLEYGASVNVSSEHPLASAIVEYSKNEGITLLPVEGFESITGKGVKAQIEGTNILIGNLSLMNDYGVTIDPDFMASIESEQRKGKTVPMISVNNELQGAIVISDPIKSTSKEAISILQNRGVEVIMLTGDNQFTAETVAGEVGITQFEFDCLPEDKLERIKQIQTEGKTVAMLGDGINDAPALTLSDVGIAMGNGSDVAIESADLALVNGNLKNAVRAHTLSRKVMKNIRQNLFFALIYNSLGVPIAAGILYPIFGMLLSPMIAALAMSFSSVSVIANALRLKSMKLNI